jgi:hypothetical protein
MIENSHLHGELRDFLEDDRSKVSNVATLLRGIRTDKAIQITQYYSRGRIALPIPRIHWSVYGLFLLYDFKSHFLSHPSILNTIN